MKRHTSANKSRFPLAVLAAVSLLALVAGCSQKNSTGGSSKTANLVYVNWAEGVDYTHLAKAILEDKMGYKVTITAADVGPAYTAVAQGDKDAFMETWLPVLHKNYMDRFKDQIVDLGPVYQGTESGLVVPDYVTIDKISQLNSVRDKFDGKIIGIDAGAGIMQTAAQAIKDYDLKYTLITSSGPAMTAALKDAIDRKEWIVVTGWRPHWMFGRWHLKFLQQDPDKVIWKKGHIDIIGRKNLEKDKPELAQFLKNMHFTDAQLSDLMLKVEDSKQDIDSVVHKWMDDHTDLINSWIPKSAAAPKK